MKISKRTARRKAIELGHRLTPFKPQYSQIDPTKALYFRAYCKVCEATAFAGDFVVTPTNPALSRECTNG